MKSPEWLSNAYLVADEPGGAAVIIDSGGPSEPLLAKIEELDVTPSHLLLTHHHHDHVAENHVYKEKFGVEILAHPLEAERLLDVDRTIDPGPKVLEVGGLSIDALHTPGHTDGMLNFVVNHTDVFTGDTLFKGSVGGVKAPGSTSFEDLKASIMDLLMKLPPETRVHPGHTDPTTIGDEYETNAFVRLWRGRARRATRRSPSGRTRRPSSYGATTTTAATRPGSAGRSRARTTSCPAPRWCAAATPTGLGAADRPLAGTAARVEHRRAFVLLGLAGGGGVALAANACPCGGGELVLAAVGAVGADRPGLPPDSHEAIAWRAGDGRRGRGLRLCAALALAAVTRASAWRRSVRARPKSAGGGLSATGSAGGGIGRPWPRRRPARARRGTASERQTAFACKTRLRGSGTARNARNGSRRGRIAPA